MKPHNIDVNGKTRPTSTKGIATPKTKAHLEETERIIKGDAKKAGGAVMKQNRKWINDGHLASGVHMNASPSSGKRKRSQERSITKPIWPSKGWPATRGISSATGS